jgi:hypothetical protein
MEPNGKRLTGLRNGLGGQLGWHGHNVPYSPLHGHVTKWA